MLKKANVEVAPAAKSKSEIMVVSVRGNSITRYNKADAEYKDAEAKLKELRPEVLVTAVKKLMGHNVANPMAPVDSIRLEDDNGSQLRMSFTSRYKQADGAAADEAFTTLCADVNEYAQETVVAGFDSKVFLDKNGEFDAKVFTAFSLAIKAVADKLGKTMPLTSKTVVLPKPQFHTLRWSKFTTVEQQMTLFSVLPNTVQLVAEKVMDPVQTAANVKR